jgi:hypothetical protein
MQTPQDELRRLKYGMLEADKVASGLDEMIRFQNFLIRIEAFLQLQTVRILNVHFDPRVTH